MLLQVVPWHCRTVHATHICVNELCMEVRGHLRKVLIQFFIKNKNKKEII